MTLPLSSISRCFEGVIPATVATCSADGTPNIAEISQVHYLDERHVALSRQFFNKTARNLQENPQASATLWDPLSYDRYELRLRFVRSETSGPLFDTMATRIQAIASHTGMAGVFRLLAADVFEVLQVVHESSLQPERAGAKVTSALLPPREDQPASIRSELWALQRLSARINQAGGLAELLQGVLDSLNEDFGFRHTLLLLPDCTGKTLEVAASVGYGDEAVGLSVRMGEGIIGTVAAEKRLVRLSRLDSHMRYGRAVRDQVRQNEGRLNKEVPLPGLPDAQSEMVLPLLRQDRLVGVLAMQSRDTLSFSAWHESFLSIAADHMAMAIDTQVQSEIGGGLPAPAAAHAPTGQRARRTFTLFRHDDCVFIDGHYLVRNIPARLLWKMLSGHAQDGRQEFSNREMRLDTSLGLPSIKDNLESRLILLRKRLEARCPDVRIMPCGRGRFRLELDCEVELVESTDAQVKAVP